METNKEQAAEQAMAALKEAKENLARVKMAIKEAYDLMLENGLGLPENRKEISNAVTEATNLGCLIHPTLIRRIEND